MAVPLQVIAKHAFHKILLNVKMSDFEVKMKKNMAFFKYRRQDICSVNNAVSTLMQVKKTTLNFKTLPVRLHKLVFKLIKN